MVKKEKCGRKKVKNVGSISKQEIEEYPVELCDEKKETNISNSTASSLKVAENMKYVVHKTNSVEHPSADTNSVRSTRKSSTSTHEMENIEKKQAQRDTPRTCCCHHSHAQCH
ncbi:unnamed protein product [Caenorhabditis auriculariae]|uniref:Uncharacterized protein n=1 Tax=Caenorhabditis auriculariae TaxID=2777116 RepID=A0A8S1HND8_9PELO|nr:unnamed protein product [Caenorhabditis auriculariae]